LAADRSRYSDQAAALDCNEHTFVTHGNRIGKTRYCCNSA
jgi:hypothetical protein